MMFGGVRPVLHLPFANAPGETIVASELTSLVDSMIGAGVDGLVVLGLASEAWTLTERERHEVMEVTVSAIAGRVPLVVGLDGAEAVAVDRGRKAARLGAAGLMVLPPRQARDARTLVRHFATVAESTGLPVLMQDSPQVSGVPMDLSAIVKAVEAHPLVSSLKVEVPGASAKVSAAHNAGVEIVAGWGGHGYLEQLGRGAVGCMPGCDLGPAFVGIDRAAGSGDRVVAANLYRQILPLLSFETASLDLLLLGAKRHLRRQRIFSSERLRSPGRALDEHEEATVDALLDELAELEVPGFVRVGSA